MLEWLVVGVPAAFSALVFTLALATQPSQIIVQDVTTSSTLEEAGFPAETLAHLLESRADRIISDASSFYDTKQIDVGTFGTPLATFADVLQLVRPVRATQQFLGLVDYVAEVHVTSQDSEVAAKLLVNNADSLIVTAWQQMTVSADSIEALLDHVAADLVGVAEPTVMAAYLYRRTMAQGGTPPDFGDALQYIKAMLPLVRRDDLARLYNLLARMAEESYDLDAAAEYCQIALRHQPRFPLAQVNWGRVDHRRGQYAQAIERYRLALGAERNLPIAYVYLAEALVAQGRLRAALGPLRQAATRAPDYARIYEVRALIHERLDLPRRAELDRRQAALARARQPRQSFYDAV